MQNENEKYPFDYFEMEFTDLYERMFPEGKQNKKGYEVPYLEFEGEKIYWMDERDVNEEFEAMIELISANPKYNPSIILDCNFDKGEQLYSYGNEGLIEIFASYWLSGKNTGPFYFSGKLNVDKKLLIYNNSEETDFWGGGIGGFAMKKEVCEDGSIIYHCNGYDEENKKSFDEIVFRLTILK